MNAVPAALFLMDFGGVQPAEELMDDALAGEEVAVVAAFTTDPVDEAYVRGVEDGKAAVEAEIVARLEEQKATFEQDLAASRKSWCLEEGVRIAEQFHAAILAMEERIADSTDRVLRPFLTQAIRTQAIGELRTTLQDLVSKAPGIALEISGPGDLLEALRTSLAAQNATVSYVANEEVDVQVKAGASILETRIAAWLGQIEGPRL